MGVGGLVVRLTCPKSTLCACLCVCSLCACRSSLLSFTFLLWQIPLPALPENLLLAALWCCGLWSSQTHYSDVCSWMYNTESGRQTVKSEPGELSPQSSIIKTISGEMLETSNQFFTGEPF